MGGRAHIRWLIVSFKKISKIDVRRRVKILVLEKDFSNEGFGNVRKCCLQMVLQPIWNVSAYKESTRNQSRTKDIFT